jgi:hydrogenase maturation protease
MRVLVAGLGNLFLGDDGFGVEVVRRLRDEGLPAGVDVADFGVRSVHLAFELTDGRYDAAILVDAMSRGEPPGTLFVVEPEAELAPDADTPDAHALTPASVLAWVRRVGGGVRRITVIGCEPGSVEEAVGLTPPVTAAVPEAVRMVRARVAAIVSCA